MGCCKSKVFVNFNYFFHQNNKIIADKRSQVSRLNDILKKIEGQIKKIKESDISRKEFTKKACYLSQMIIFIKWTIKIIDVNQEDPRIDQMIDKADILVNDNDEFKLISLENKIKHILNKK